MSSPGMARNPSMKEDLFTYTLIGIIISIIISYYDYYS